MVRMSGTAERRVGPRMRRFRTQVLFALYILPILAARAGAPGPDFSALVDKAAPAVVNISTLERGTPSKNTSGAPESDATPNGGKDDLDRRFFADPPPSGSSPPPLEAASLGSGFIISADGYILTNYHVIQGADEIIVKLSDRRQLPATLVGADTGTDLAVLRIHASDLPIAVIGDAGKVRPGQWVLAIGSPFGFEHSVTAGIVSALGRSIGTERYVPFIQTDVPINPGNSGGPLFNMDGEVIGINSQIYSRTGGYMGVSFAVPINLAMEVAGQLRRSGHVSRGWIGVNVQDVSRTLAESFGMSRPEGALIRSLVPDGPAQQAGLQVGDIILQFNGEKVFTASMLPPMVGEAPVGRAADLEVYRQGRRVKLSIMVTQLKDQTVAGRSPAAGAREGDLGLVVRDPTAAERALLELPPDRGVLVDSVAAGPGRDAGLKAGDAILMIDQKPVSNARGFRRALDGLTAGQAVAVLVQRHSETLFLALRTPGGGK